MGLDYARILRLDEVLKLCGVSKSGMYQMIQTGAFPAPVRTGGAARGVETRGCQGMVGLAGTNVWCWQPIALIYWYAAHRCAFVESATPPRVVFGQANSTVRLHTGVRVHGRRHSDHSGSEYRWLDRCDFQ